jgi:hypothetical protein
MEEKNEITSFHLEEIEWRQACRLSEYRLRPDNGQVE